MTYAPLEDYGFIGDLRTGALIGRGGGVDWLCYPHFDSPSVFAALLDDHKGGRFEVTPEKVLSARQTYLHDTCVLLTTFACEGGVVQLTDLMPVPKEARVSLDRPLGRGGPPPRLLRRVKVISGEVPIRVSCAPAFDYGRAPHTLGVNEDGAVFRSQALTLYLHAPTPLKTRGGAAVAEFILKQGEEVCFSLSAEDGLSSADFALQESDTLAYWRGWIAQCRYDGLWQEAVRRSALTLKLLTFAPSGAIVAAATTSLPERIGGERNWDYRFTWPRDAAFSVYALLSLGFTAEARAFGDFIQDRSKEGEPGVLRPVYHLDGDDHLKERTLDHLAGYKDSRPVRVGNAAEAQFQLDVYGEYMDALYLYDERGEPLSYDTWCEVRHMLDWVCQHWRDKDNGIWEVRSERQNHVLSKVMAWVALERGLRLAQRRGLPGDVERWRLERDTIYEEVMARGYSERLGAFTQTYDNTQMDAANLLLPMVKFVGPRDPRWLSTLDAIQKKLSAGPLVYRYRLDQGAEDGLHGQEGAFVACSFWLVECLACAGRLDEARSSFEQLLAFASPLGLLSEEINHEGLLTGNLPQALSHLSLISAALHLDRGLKGELPS